MTAGWALVTGACSGIGLAIARELASRGHPLVLVSNREAELGAVARQLSSENKVAAHAIAMDLARPEAALTLYEEVRRRGLEVEILVSNAGVFFFGEVADTDPSQACAMLQLHVVTPSLLALYFGQDMRARRRGHLLFVSSISAWRDFPGIAYYGSSKRYLRSFAASLREELGTWGVNVTCLAPGAVATNLYEKTGVPVEIAVKYSVMKDPARVARAGVRGMFRRKAVVVPGLSAKLMALGMTLIPHWLIKLIRTRSPLLPRPGD
jgi:short-subunit dehydrogenase